MRFFCLTLLSERGRPEQTLNQSAAEWRAELESFSCGPADVQRPHVLMAFYGSLESLWLLVTQWDSLQRQRGLQREGQPQYIADAEISKHKEKQSFWRDFNLWISGFHLECITCFDALIPWIIFLLHFWAITMYGLCREWDYAPSVCKAGCLGQIFSVNSVVTILLY